MVHETIMCIRTRRPKDGRLAEPPRRMTKMIRAQAGPETTCSNSRLAGAFRKPRPGGSDHEGAIGVSPGNSYFSAKRLRDLGQLLIVDSPVTDVHAESSARRFRRAQGGQTSAAFCQDHHHGERTDPPAVRRPMSEFQSTRHAGSCMYLLTERRRDGAPSARTQCASCPRRVRGICHQEQYGSHLCRGPAGLRHTCDSRSAVVAPIATTNHSYARGSTTSIGNQGPRHCSDGSLPNDRDRSASRSRSLHVGIGFLTSQNYEPASLSAGYGPLLAPKLVVCTVQGSRIDVFPEGNRRCRRPRLERADCTRTTWETSPTRDCARR